MYKNLRIICTVLSALFIAAILPAGMFFDWLGITVCFLGALLFFGLMLLCKQSQEMKENKNTSPEPSFFAPDPSEKKKNDTPNGKN